MIWYSSSIIGFDFSMLGWSVIWGCWGGELVVSLLEKNIHKKGRIAPLQPDTKSKYTRWISPYQYKQPKHAYLHASKRCANVRTYQPTPIYEIRTSHLLTRVLIQSVDNGWLEGKQVSLC